MAVQTEPSPDSRLTKVERTQDVHAQQLQDHDKVLTALVKHLGQIVDRMDRFEKRLIIVGIIIFSGTKNGAGLLDHISSFLN